MVFRLCFLLIIYSYIPANAAGDCHSNGETYNSGDHWQSQNGCVLNTCGNDSTIKSYKKVCPPVPQCIPSRVQTKDCCQYCKGDEVDASENGDMDDGYETHACKRECVSGRPMTCKYTLKIELYESCNDACFNCPFNLTDCDRKNCVPLDGVSRLSIATNRMIPGPSIHVCRGDTIIADVQNALLSQGLTMHWHGIDQHRTPYMDGVPHIHQCPISAGNTFRYTFYADEPGTYFYHPHTGAQVTDGCAGFLIIRQPDSENPHRDLYDKDLYEHALAIKDWQHLYSEDDFTRFYYLPNTSALPNTILINGRGRITAHNEPPKLVSSTSDVQKAMDKLDKMPFTVFTVEKGYRYRFRILNGASQICPISISIDKHNMTVISTDGYDVEPFEVQELVSNDAERFDIVLNANQEINNYWIRVKGLSLCRDMQIQQFAILHYKGSLKTDPKQSMDFNYPKINGLRLGNVPVEERNEKTFKISELRSIRPPDIGISNAKPDETFYIRLDFNMIRNEFVRASPDSPQRQIFELNNISLELPPGVLLTDPDTLQDTSIICNDTTLQNQNCSEQLCSCVYVHNVRLNSIVEVIMFNEGLNDVVGIEHPMHYHGYTYRVVAMERVPGLTEKKLREMNERGEIKRNLVNPTPKDTVIIYNPGYTIFRFNASNPGIWLLHCHQQFHLTQGKGVFIHVGEYTDLPPAPPQYVKCNNFVPM